MRNSLRGLARILLAVGISLLLTAYAVNLDIYRRKVQVVESPKANTLPEKLQQKISLHFVNADIRYIIRCIARSAKLNITINERAFRKGVNYRITIFLKDVSIAEALEIMLRSKEIDYRIGKDIIFVGYSGEGYEDFTIEFH